MRPTSQMKKGTLKSQTMTSIKKTVAAVVVLAGILSTTSCGSIHCHAYASNETDQESNKEIVEETPQWAEATFVQALPAS